MKTSLFTGKVIAIVAAAFLVGFASGALTHRAVMGIKSNGTVEDSSSNSEIEYNEVKIEADEEINSAINEIEKLFKFIQSKPAYLEVATSSEGYDSYMYNSHNEIAVQASDGHYTTIFTKDGKSIRCNSSDKSMDKDTAIDIMTTMKNVVTGLKERKSGFSLYTTEVEGFEGVKEYIIETKGPEACKEAYKSVSEEYADKMIETLVGYISEMEGKQYDPIIRYGVIFDSSNAVNMYCSILVNDESNLNWYCNGYIHTDDWELEPDWYTTEFNQDNLEKLIELTRTEATKLGEVLNKLTESFDTSTSTSTGNNESSGESTSEVESSSSSSESTANS